MSKHITRLSASEVVELLGVTIKALRLYERQGLVTPVVRQPDIESTVLMKCFELRRLPRYGH